MDAKPVKPGASLSFVETPYRRQTLSYVLAFSPRLCDVLLDVEGEASVPRVRSAYRRQTLSYVLAFSPRLCDVLLDA